jgi:hypothetical protein
MTSVHSGARTERLQHLAETLHGGVRSDCHDCIDIVRLRDQGDCMPIASRTCTSDSPSRRIHGTVERADLGLPTLDAAKP